MPLKSTIKQLKPLDTEVSVTIDHLRADKNIVDAHFKHLTNIYKNDQPEQINRRINEIIARDNLFNAVMNEAAKCFEVTYDQDELKQVMTNIKPNFEGRDDVFLKSVAEKIVAKTLIFFELKKLWKIEVTNQEVDNSLNLYNTQTGEGIRQYKEELMITPEDKAAAKAKYEGVRNVITDEKISAGLLRRYVNVKINWDSVKKDAEEFAKKQAEQTDKA